MLVNEIFLSIQGEGKYIGLPQVFLRLTGCNLRCKWCDTPQAIDPKNGTEKSVDEVMKEIETYRIKSVCITGGEPMLQPEELQILVKKLKNRDYFIILETNGTLYDSDIFNAVDCVSMDIKPPSSKEKSDENLIARLEPKDQIKIIIANDGDYEFAKEMINKAGADIDVILQPQGGIKTKSLVGQVLNDRLRVRVLPQLHKIIGIK